MESFWLIAAIASLVVVLVIMYQRGLQENLQLLIFPLLAGAMFAFRRTFRRRYEKKQNENGDK